MAAPVFFVFFIEIYIAASRFLASDEVLQSFEVDVRFPLFSSVFFNNAANNPIKVES